MKHLPSINTRNSINITGAYIFVVVKLHCAHIMGFDGHKTKNSIVTFFFHDTRFESIARTKLASKYEELMKNLKYRQKSSSNCTTITSI